MTTINVRTDGKAVVLEIADDERVRCKLKLTEKRARELSAQLVTASLKAQDVESFRQKLRNHTPESFVDEWFGDLFGKRGGR